MSCSEPNTYFVDSTIKLNAKFTASDGTPVDPEEIIAYVRSSAGITPFSGVQIIRDAQGEYHVNYTIAVSGDHWYRFEGHDDEGVIGVAQEARFKVNVSRALP